MRLKDKVAVVTGAASGIGKEIARTFVREGAKVAIADLNQAGADATAAELGGPDARIGVAMDVTNEEQVDAGMAKVVAAFGRVDMLVEQCRHPDRRAARPVRVRQMEAAAGHPSRRRVPHHARRAAADVQAGHRRQHHLHGLGALQGGLAAEGALCHRQARPDRAAKVVAKEGAKHGVRANVICPGFVRTPLVDKQIPEQAKELGISEQDVIKKSC